MTTNEIETVSVLATNEGERLQALGETVIIKTERYGIGLAEIVLQPGSSNPLHRHPAWEMFYVTEGVVEVGMVVDGAPTSRAMAQGTTVVVPSDVPHCLHNPGPGEARLVIVYQDSIGPFFRDLAACVADVPPGPPSDEVIGRVVQTATAHGQTILGPHPATV